ncbi:YopX family protein [Flavobacterium columnare]|uniref:YopX family protein n=1 Tax=Flavobacterium columnare TaxID=996 RepID=UPI004034C64F
MNREIKFRGFQKSWIFGGVTIFEGQANIFDKNCVANSSYEVELNSVGQFTGFTDKKGIEIYEDDLCKYHHNSSKWLISYSFRVVFHQGAFYAYWEREMMGKLEQHWDLLSKIDLSKVKVVSNVFEKSLLDATQAE